MRRFAGSACILAALVFSLPQAATAQTGGDLAIGYSYLAADGLAVNASSLPGGVFFGTAWRVNETFSIAADVNGHFKRGIEPSADTTVGGVVAPLATEDFQVFSFNRTEAQYCSPILTDCHVGIQTVGLLIGPRLHFGPGYFHVLGGVQRSLRKIGFFAHTGTHFAIQPGVGVDAPMTPNTAFRIQADYRMVFLPTPDQTNPAASLVIKDGADFKEFTFSVGVVVKLGAQRQ